MDKNLQTLETYNFSALVAFLAGSQPNACFKDAWEALINLPQWFRHGTYVEGWIVIELASEILVIEHGWCMLPDGRVVDPAIVFLIGPEQSVIYFPGVAYTWEETLAFEGELLPHVWETSKGGDGMQHPAYKAAYEEALKIATRLSITYDPHKKLAIHTAQSELEGQSDPQMEEIPQWIIYVVSSSLQVS